jgi:hypothetical protein
MSNKKDKKIISRKIIKYILIFLFITFIVVFIFLLYLTSRTFVNPTSIDKDDNSARVQGVSLTLDEFKQIDSMLDADPTWKDNKSGSQKCLRDNGMLISVKVTVTNNELQPVDFYGLNLKAKDSDIRISQIPTSEVLKVQDCADESMLPGNPSVIEPSQNRQFIMIYYKPDDDLNNYELELTDLKRDYIHFEVTEPE